MAERIPHPAGPQRKREAEETYGAPRTRFVAEFMGVDNFFPVRCLSRCTQGTRFETARGLILWSRDSLELVPGLAGMLGVRSEAMRLTLGRPRPGGEAVNIVLGEVVEAIFEGGSRRWTIQIPSGERLIVRGAMAANALPLERTSPGARVYLSWEPQRSLVYPASGASLPPLPPHSDA